MSPYWWFPFPWFLLTALFLFLLFRFAILRGKRGSGCRGGSFDAESILKRRLASGQITEDEFRRLRHVMKETAS